MEVNWEKWKFLHSEWFEYSIHHGSGWFRLFGYGLCWKNTKMFTLTFSERVCDRGAQIWHYRMHFLTRTNLYNQWYAKIDQTVTNIEEKRKK